MLKNISKMCGVLLILLGTNMSQAASVVDDQLNNLIRNVESQSQKEQADRLNSQVARASWRIKCWVRVFEDTKICVMQKNDLTIMRLNDTYSVSIGGKHQKNTMTQIRIDTGEVMEAREGLYRDAMPVIDQMKRGYNLFSRYKSQDKGSNVDRKVSLMGFTDAFNDMQLQYRRLDSSASAQNF